MGIKRENSLFEVQEGVSQLLSRRFEKWLVRTGVSTGSPIAHRTLKGCETPAVQGVSCSWREAVASKLCKQKRISFLGGPPENKSITNPRRDPPEGVTETYSLARYLLNNKTHRSWDKAWLVMLSSLGEGAINTVRKVHVKLNMTHQAKKHTAHCPHIDYHQAVDNRYELHGGQGHLPISKKWPVIEAISGSVSTWSLKGGAGR